MSSDEKIFKEALLEKKKGRKKKRKLKPAKPTKKVEVQYRRELMQSASEIHREVRARILPILRKRKNTLVIDSVEDDLQEVFRDLRKVVTTLNSKSQIRARRMVRHADKTNKERYYKSLSNVLGVDLGGLVQEEDLDTRLNISVRENVALIKSIPTEYLDKVESLVYRNVIQGTDNKSMIEQIGKLHKKGIARSKFIARDQTAKLNASVNRYRNQNLGITKYIWRTSGDGDRVREAHRTHNGKTFSWDKPPKNTGHPGEDFQCRCIAEPIIEF